MHWPSEEHHGDREDGHHQLGDGLLGLQSERVIRVDVEGAQGDALLRLLVPSPEKRDLHARSMSLAYVRERNTKGCA